MSSLVLSEPGLAALALGGLGRFEPAPATFTVTQPRLPRRWDYLYANDHLLLRIAQDGTGYLQAKPPEGILVFRPERLEKTPVFHVWFQEAGGETFSNFPLAHVAGGFKHECTFSPGEACYAHTRAGWRVETRLTLAADSAALLVRVVVRRNAITRARLRILPALRPHVGPAVLAPWDVLELYQTCRAGQRPAPCVLVETRSPAGRPEERHRAVLMTDLQCGSAEVSLERFVGEGDFIRPDALKKASLAVDLTDGTADAATLAGEHAVQAQLPVAALEAWVDFAAGEEREFSLVLACATGGEEETLVKRAHRLLGAAAFARGAERLAGEHRAWCERLVIRTPDPAFDDYMNHWVPAQLHWVSRLDRGWPTGMRGTRDAAQDFSGVARLFPEKARAMLLQILACQRSDGWFPRQFSAQGPEGKHDLRDYVDSGCWVFELLVDVLRYGGEAKLLEEPVRWLDSAAPSSVREHATRLLDYFLTPKNRGPHDLILIRGGDWNDALNQAGAEGVGESVMVSCHVIHLLELATRWLGPDAAQRGAWHEAAVRLRSAVRKHALNSRGFLNGVFTDNREWVFSDRDPDGACRRNGAVNAFGLIAGVFASGEVERVLSELDQLKGPHGWRLFHPPLGVGTPIEKLGRMGHGDLLPGAAENGTVYNHGSQGFLARALAAVGDRARLWEVVRHILPYDQAAHPLRVAKTAPYAIVNHWMEIPDHEGEGGAAFLSGTISTLQRVVLDGLLGFHVEPEGLRFRPVLPPGWREAGYRIVFRGTVLDVALVAGTRAAVSVEGRGLADGVLPFSELVPGRSLRVRVELKLA